MSLTTGRISGRRPSAAKSRGLEEAPRAPRPMVVFPRGWEPLGSEKITSIIVVEVKTLSGPPPRARFFGCADCPPAHTVVTV